MKHLLLFTCIIIVLQLLNQSPLVNAECNVCNSETGKACISKTEYKECDENNKPFGYTYSCNEDYYCSLLGNCTKDEDFSDCNFCKKCDENRVFACKGTKIFALCLGGDEPSEITGECNENTVCNINNAQICGLDEPTCSYTDDPVTQAPTTTTIAPTTTTPSPSQDPNAFCQGIQKTGRYPAGSNPQTTCRQYISCVKVGSNWYGPIYNCPGQTFYDPTKKNCVATQPSTCGGTVGRLAFRNILLE
ncbi:hypothetical protein CVS40_3741 [Lucilia cuprina]|nr:hypothetical protein CVS40_3741 [Lucilia cuprina]